MLRRYRSFLATFCCMLSLSLAVVTTLTLYKNKTTHQQMKFLAISKSAEIVEAIYALLYKAEALATLVIQGDGVIQDFDRIAPIIINSPVIRNIVLAPGGIVSRVYPKNSNEALPGFNLLGPQGDGNMEARLARDTRKLTLGGPFTGVQGSQILVGRLPVTINNNGQSYFWGLVSVTLNYPEALSPVRLSELDNLGYACEIWRINPDTGVKQVILNTNSRPMYKPVEREFSLLNARWIISISPLSPWYKDFSLYAMLAAATIFSLLTATVAQNYWEMRQVRTSLEYMAMYDSLTGLPNRRAAFETLESTVNECRATGEKFVLGYLDLNDFKAINDTHGHNIGDCVLKETAQRITAAMPPGQFVGRIGGDEFIIILRTGDATRSSELLMALHEAMTKPFAPKLITELYTSLSMGVAIFPDNGATSEELTVHADMAMYTNKEQHRIKRRGCGREMAAMAWLSL